MFKLVEQKKQITLIDRKGKKQTIDVEDISYLSRRKSGSMTAQVRLKNGTHIPVACTVDIIAEMVFVLTGTRPTVV